jgi:hypothetical protein
VAWSGDVKVAFINPIGPPEFWQLVCTTMKAAAAELRINVEIRDSHHHRDKAIAIGRDFLAERPPPDYLIATDFTRFSKTRNPAVARYNFSPDAVLGQLEANH